MRIQLHFGYILAFETPKDHGKSQKDEFFGFSSNNSRNPNHRTFWLGPSFLKMFFASFQVFLELRKNHFGYRLAFETQETLENCQKMRFLRFSCYNSRTADLRTFWLVPSFSKIFSASSQVSLEQGKIFFAMDQPLKQKKNHGLNQKLSFFLQFSLNDLTLIEPGFLTLRNNDKV